MAKIDWRWGSAAGLVVAAAALAATGCGGSDAASSTGGGAGGESASTGSRTSSSTSHGSGTGAGTHASSGTNSGTGTTTSTGTSSGDGGASSSSGAGGASSSTGVGAGPAGTGIVFPPGGGDPVLSPPKCADPGAGSRVLYVDGTAGDDANDGLSAAHAFKTISHAVHGGGAPAMPGDVVMIAGGLYRERVDMTQSGTAAARILVRPLDDHEVIVDGSDEVTGWTAVTGSPDTFHATPGFDVQAVVAGETPLWPATSANAVAAGFFFYDAGSGDLVVHLPQGGAPDPASIGVVAVDDNKTQQAFFLDHASYVTVCGLTTRYAGAKGVQILGDYDRIEQCKIEFNGGIGLSIFPYGGTVSTDAEIVGNEIRDNFLRNWPRCSNGYKDGGWGTGASSQGTPNTKFVGNLVHHNGGEGLVASGTDKGALIQGNVAFDNWSVDLYVLNTENVTIDGNYVFSNDPVASDLTNNGDPDPTDHACQKRLRPDGIDTGDEDIGAPGLLSHVTITNNFIVHCRHGLAHVNEVTGSGLKNVTVAFNTIVLPPSFAAYESPTGLDVQSNAGANAGTVYRDNIVIATAGQALLVNGGGPASDVFQGVTFDHDLFFHATNAKPFSWNGTTYAHAAFVALGAGQGQGDVVADPKLVGADVITPASGCPADATSPAVDVGVDAQVSVDYFGTARPSGGGFDIGACELP